MNERLSHQIGHAWIGGAIEPMDHDSDGWLVEGLAHRLRWILSAHLLHRFECVENVIGSTPLPRPKTVVIRIHGY